MSILLLLLLCGLVVVVAGVWLATTLLTTIARALGWFLTTLFGGGGSSRHADVARCPNDKCNASWRPDARYCGRCGTAANGVSPRLRIARVA